MVNVNKVNKVNNVNNVKIVNNVLEQDFGILLALKFKQVNILNSKHCPTFKLISMAQKRAKYTAALSMLSLIHLLHILMQMKHGDNMTSRNGRGHLPRI